MIDLKKLLKNPPAPEPVLLQIPARRTDCHTGESRIVQVGVEVKYHDSLAGWWVHIHGGPTGYESAEAKRILASDRKSWSACAGTRGRWDSLLLEQDGLAMLREWLAESSELHSP